MFIYSCEPNLKEYTEIYDSFFVTFLITKYTILRKELTH